MKIKDVFRRFPELKCFIHIDRYTDEYCYKYEKYKKDNKILLLKEKNEIVEFYILNEKESKLVKFKDVPRENGPAVIIYNSDEKISDKIYCLNGKKCDEFQKEVIKQLEEN